MDTRISTFQPDPDKFPAVDYQWRDALHLALSDRMPLDEDYCPLDDMFGVYTALLEATVDDDKNERSELVIYERAVQPGLNSFLVALDGIEGVADEENCLAAMAAYREGMAALRRAAEHMRLALVAEARWAEAVQTKEEST